MAQGLSLTITWFSLFTRMKFHMNILLYFIQSYSVSSGFTCLQGVFHSDQQRLRKRGRRKGYGWNGLGTEFGCNMVFSVHENKVSDA